MIPNGIWWEKGSLTARGYGPSQDESYYTWPATRNKTKVSKRVLDAPKLRHANKMDMVAI